MAGNRNRGRPKGPDTVSVTALLYPHQKKRLDFLKEYLPGGPSLTGLIRDAVDEYLDKLFTDEVRDAYSRMQEDTDTLGPKLVREDDEKRA